MVLIKSACPYHTFPYILGGTDGRTSFYTLDYDDQQNIVVGGSTQDQGLLGSYYTSQVQPVIGYIGYNGQYKWVNFVNLPNDEIISVSFFNSGQEIFALYINPILTISRFSSSDGSVSKTYNFPWQIVAPYV